MKKGKICFIILFGLLQCLNGASQSDDLIFVDEYGDSQPEGKVEIFEDADLFGYKSNTGEILIPPIYDYLSKLYEENIFAKKDGKSGLINLQNEIVIPFLYDDLKGFEGFKPDNKKRYIGRVGGSSYLIDSIGQNIISDKKSFHLVGSFIRVRDANGIKSLYRLDGTVLIDTLVTVEYLQYDDLEYYVINLKHENEVVKGLYDKNLKVVLEPKYTYFKSCANGILIKDTSNYYLFNPLVTEVQNIGEYESVSSLDNVNFVVKKDNRYGLLNSTFDQVISPKFDEFEYRQPYCYFIDSSGEIVVTNTKAEIEIRKYFKEYDFSYYGHLYLKDLNDKVFYYDYELNQPFVGFSSFKEVTELLLLGQNQDGYKILVDHSSNFSYQYTKLKKDLITKVDSLADGLYLFTTESNYKYTYPSARGQHVENIERIEQLNSKFFKSVTKSNKVGVIREYSKIIVPYEFDNVEILNDNDLPANLQNASKPIFKASFNGEISYYDSKGNLLE